MIDVSRVSHVLVLGRQQSHLFLCVDRGRHFTSFSICTHSTTTNHYKHRRRVGRRRRLRRVPRPGGRPQRRGGRAGQQARLAAVRFGGTGGRGGGGASFSTKPNACHFTNTNTASTPLSYITTALRSTRAAKTARRPPLQARAGAFTSGSNRAARSRWSSCTAPRASAT
jgi:hypothetical protein